MRNRGAAKCDLNRECLPPEKLRIVDSFFEPDVRLADRLFWKVLCAVRRNTLTPTLFSDIKNMPEQQRAKMWRLAHRWLPAPEFKFFTEHLKEVKEKELGWVDLRLPFAKNRAVTALLLSRFRSAL